MKWLMEIRCAVRAAGCLDGDVGVAVRTLPGGWRGDRGRCGLLLEAVDPLDHQEDDQGDDEEINYIINEVTVGDLRAAESESET